MNLMEFFKSAGNLIRGVVVTAVKAILGLQPGQALSAGFFAGGAIFAAVLFSRGAINTLRSFRNRSNVSPVQSALTMNTDKQSEKEMSEVTETIAHNNIFESLGKKNKKKFKSNKEDKGLLKRLKAARLKRQIQEEHDAAERDGIFNTLKTDASYDVQKFNEDATDIVDSHPEVFRNAVKNLSIV